jgi:CBS domain-containing protein
MTLQDILRTKGSLVQSIGPQATLQEVVQRLVQHNIGSLVVCEGNECERGELRGIITERDILRACAKHTHDWHRVPVSSVMTTDVLVGRPDDSVEETMGTMTENRVRHLPIVVDGQLVGIISIGDVVKAQHDELTMENHYLKNYIHG